MKKVAGILMSVVLIASLSGGFVLANTSNPSDSKDSNTTEVAAVSKPALGGWDKGWRDLLKRKMNEVL